MQMLQEIMLPVRPKWCELIASEKKTIEFRKTKPNCDIPFKVYIYCTIKGDVLCPPHLNCNKYAIHRKNNGTITGRCMTEKEKTESDYKYANGKVIGEFVCDKIHSIHVPSDIRYCVDFGIWSPLSERLLHNACITPKEALDYAGNKEFIFGWHISDLKIYDEPKQLDEFYVKCNEGCEDCFLWQFIRVNADEFDMECMSEYYGHIPLKRPPQSWCYVERRD